jgi:hypothetical protein
MHAATSKVENSPQGSSCKLKFVYAYNYLIQVNIDFLKWEWKCNENIFGKCLISIRPNTHTHIFVLHVYVSMYASMYVCKYVCMQVCLYASMYASMYVCKYVCKYVCMQVCMYASMHVCKYVCMQVCMYASMYVCMYLCMCVYHSDICCFIYLFSSFEHAETC